MANVIFKVGTKALFDALEQKDTNTLYWLEDVQELYKGNLLFATGKAASQTAAGLMSAETAAKAYADGLVGALDVADSAVATQLVSAVSEEDGKITVTRRALVAEDIPEIAQSKVAGLTNALDGKQDSLVFNTAYDGSTNKVATMTDVTNAVAGLSGAMHYIGESTTDPATEVTVSGVDEFAKGDVVTYNAKEYVYDGATWRELGDESSFAVKGSIKDTDIAADAAIAQSKIAGLETALAAKATPADITTAIEGLDVADEAVSGQVVSAVVETDGKIAVSRRALVADDIPTLAIAKTLLSGGWSSGEQTLQISGVTAESNGVIGLSQSVSDAEMEAAKNAELYVCGQGTGTITIAAYGETPTRDIPVVVILLG